MSVASILPSPQYEQQLIRAKLVTNQYFQLMILPTEKCNFRCTYCYEDFSIGKMKRETVNSVKNLLLKRCQDLEYLTISWFGGEPLIAKDIMLEISEYAMDLTRQFPKLNYKADVTTNGYFLNYPTALELAKVGVIHHQISLDGPQEIHDRSRIRADGSSTYDKIWSNLVAIRNSSLPISVLLRIHFTADTFDKLDPLLEDIQREFLSDLRFSVFFKPIEHLGGPNDSSINTVSHAEQEKVIKMLKNKLFGETVETSPSAFQPEEVCYASRPNSLVIRANGDVAKCTVALNDRRNKIGTLQEDGTIDLIPGRLAPWLRGIQTLDPATLACPLVNLP